MANDARFEFVLIDGGSQSSGAPTPIPRDREDLQELLQSILSKQGVAIPQGSTVTPTVTAKSTETSTSPAPSISPDAVAPSVVQSPTPMAPPVSEPQPTPQPEVPQVERPATPEPKMSDVTERRPEPVPRSEPVPKPDPVPEFKPLTLPEPRKPEPVPTLDKPEPIDRQPTEPSKVPERFVNYPPKPEPTPITQSDLDAMKKDYGPTYDPIKAAEDFARAQQTAREKKAYEEYEAERQRNLAKRAEKMKSDHERAMAASDEAIKNRYGAVDAKKIFEELRADAKAAADLKYGPSPRDQAKDIIDASVSDAKESAKTTATAAAGKLAETAGKSAASSGAAGAAGGIAGGGAAGGALGGIAATAATGTLAGLAVALPSMAYRSIELYTDKLVAALGDLSPEIAMAQARADTAMTFRRLEMSRQFGPDLAKIVEADSDMAVAGSRVAGAFIGPIVRDFADFKKGMGDVVEQLGKFVDNNRSFFEQITEGAIDGSGFGWVGDLGRLLTWMTGGGDQQQTFGTFLDDLDFITPPGWDQAPSSEPEEWGVLFR